MNELTHRGGVDLETYFDMGYLQSKLTVDLSCVNVLVRPTRAPACFAAPVRGRKAV